MRERPKLSEHLYIRVDGDLRRALEAVAAARSRTVSDLARIELRRAVAAANGSAQPADCV